MERIYASLIIKGKRTLSSIPTKFQKTVKQMLINDGYGYLIEGGLE